MKPHTSSPQSGPGQLQCQCAPVRRHDSWQTSWILLTTSLSSNDSIVGEINGSESASAPIDRRQRRTRSAHCHPPLAPPFLPPRPAPPPAPHLFISSRLSGHGHRISSPISEGNRFATGPAGNPPSIAGHLLHRAARRIAIGDRGTSCSPPPATCRHNPQTRSLPRAVHVPSVNWEDKKGADTLASERCITNPTPPHGDHCSPKGRKSERGMPLASVCPRSGPARPAEPSTPPIPLAHSALYGFKYGQTAP